jgi:hypothetical protein
LKINKTFDASLSNSDQEALFNIINHFETIPTMIGKGKRNVVKITDFNGQPINIKSFKIPNIINKVVYRFFRKSKAKRSFEYANKLLNFKINTPKPLGYVEFLTPLFLENSYYISKQLTYDFTIRELVDNPNFEDFENIVRQFTQFTFFLHQKGINFLDHSPGNTLIIKKGDAYVFYLIDLNRMKFEKMDFHKRMKNFAKLSPKDKMLEIMADEYAKLFPQKSKDEILKTMQLYSNKFSNRYKKKEQFKQRYFFWRK